MLSLGYSLEERYLHDPQTGKRLQHTIHHSPPIAGVTATLAAHSRKWQPKSDLNVTGRVALGVSVVGRQKPVDVTPKPALAPPVESKLSNEVPATLASNDTNERISEAPMAEDFSTRADFAVEPLPDRVVSSPFFKPSSPGSKKQPEGVVKVLQPETAPGDPVEAVGGTGSVADAPATAPRVDLNQLVPVREARRRIHDDLPPRNAIERQIMLALQLDLTPAAREKRLRELTGNYQDGDARHEGVGEGPRPSGLPVRVV